MKFRAAAKGRSLFRLAAAALLISLAFAPQIATAEAVGYPETRDRLTGLADLVCDQVDGELSHLSHPGYRDSYDEYVVGSLLVPQNVGRASRSGGEILSGATWHRTADPRFSAIAMSAEERASIWSRHQFVRGVRIESHLSATDYSGWYRVGKRQGGFFPLIDFQKGRNVVSLKTSNSLSAKTFESLEAHIDDLATRPFVNGLPANTMLDLRVPRGMEHHYSRLRSYAAGRIRVRIQGF